MFFSNETGLRIHQIAAGERADAADGFDEPGPQLGQIGGYRRCFSQRCWSAEHRLGSSMNNFRSRCFGPSRCRRRTHIRGCGRCQAGRSGATLAAAQLVELLQNRIEADGVARFDGLEQGDFEQDFLGRGVAQPQFGVGQRLPGCA